MSAILSAGSTSKASKKRVTFLSRLQAFFLFFLDKNAFLTFFKFFLTFFTTYGLMTVFVGDGVLFSIDFFVYFYVHLFIYLFVSSSATLQANRWTDLHKIFREGVQ